MNIITVALTILSLSATQLASIGRPKAVNDPADDRWTQTDMEIWEEFGRWRRSHPRDSDRRWSYDRQRHGRDNRGDHGRNRREYPERDRTGKPYPPNVTPPSRQHPVTPMEPEQPILNPLPIIIEPIRPMLSIIEPYPVTTEEAYPAVSTSVDYYGSSSVYYSSGTGYYSSSAYYSTPTSSYYSPTSSYYSQSAVDTSKVVKKYMPSANSTSMAYGSTTIVTVPESTATTKVTGRYRAMSNSAAASGNNIAGSISFGLVLFSSLFLLILV